MASLFSRRRLANNFLQMYNKFSSPATGTLSIKLFARRKKTTSTFFCREVEKNGIQLTNMWLNVVTNRADLFNIQTKFRCYSEEVIAIFHRCID